MYTTLQPCVISTFRKYYLMVEGFLSCSKTGSEIDKNSNVLPKNTIAFKMFLSFMSLLIYYIILKTLKFLKLNSRLKTLLHFIKL